MRKQHLWQDPELILLINNGRGFGGSSSPCHCPASLGMRPCPSSDIGFANFFLLPSPITAHSALLDPGSGSSSLPLQPIVVLF